MSGGKLVAQLNASWRLVVLNERDWNWSSPASRDQPRPSWSVEQLVNGGWHSRGTFRSREMLLWSVPLVGDIDPAALKTLKQLPKRIDLPPEDQPRPPRYVPKKRKPAPAPTAPIAATSEPSPISKTAKRFVDWRDRKTSGNDSSIRQ